MIGRNEPAPRRRRRIPRHRQVGLFSIAVLVLGIIPLVRATFEEVRLTSIAPPLVMDNAVRLGSMGVMGSGPFNGVRPMRGHARIGKPEVVPDKTSGKLLEKALPLRVRFCDVPLKNALELLMVASKVTFLIKGHMPHYLTWDTKDNEQPLSTLLSGICEAKSRQGLPVEWDEENGYILVSSPLAKYSMMSYKREEDPLPYRLAGTVQAQGGETYGLLEVRTREKIEFMTVREGTVITLDEANTYRVVALTTSRVTIADRHSTIQEYPLRGLTQEQRKSKDP